MKENTTPDITPQLFTKTFLNLVRCQCPSPEATQILLGELRRNNIEAAFCLAPDALSMDLALYDRLLINRLVLKAAKEGSYYARYLHGCDLVSRKKFSAVGLGMQMLQEAGENGVPEAYWELARIHHQDDPEKASEFAKKAADGRWPPAIAGCNLASSIALYAGHLMSDARNHDLVLARDGVRTAEYEAKRLSGELQAIKASSRHAAEQLRLRCEEAESRLASWNADAAKAEHIQRLQSEKTKAEEEWLKAKLESENAEAAKIEAERKADDLARRNKYLAGLIRKNGIPFNEYESSSSSEDGASHLGLAS